MVKNGRPTKYSQLLVEKICSQLVAGLSIRQICVQEEMPAASTIFSWLGTYPEFSEQYARAKAVGIEAIIDDMFEIADDSSNDWVKRGNRYVLNRDNIKRARLRIDTRKWLIGKLRPKKYGIHNY